MWIVFDPLPAPSWTILLNKAYVVNFDIWLTPFLSMSIWFMDAPIQKRGHYSLSFENPN